MLPAEREQNILEYLLINKQATVHDLSKEFNVHEATIRRDLTKLEQFKQIRRTHGGVVLNRQNVKHELDFDHREIDYYAEKSAIGKYAAQYINSGDTLYIDSGSTTLHLAKEIADRDNLTIITNDIHVASVLKATKNRIIVTGGILYRDNYVLCGYTVEEFLRTINPDKVFLGTPAIDADKGVTHYSELLAPSKRLMANCGSELFVLMDSSKFGKTSLHKICDLEKIDYLITDSSHSFDQSLYMNKIKNIEYAT